MRAAWMILLVVSILTALHAIPVLQNRICLGWDCPFYIFQLSPKWNMQDFFVYTIEPLFYIVVKPMELLVGIFTAIKLFQIFSFTFFLIGCWLLCRHFKFSMSTTIIIFLFLAFMPGLNRMWSDEYRNYLAVVILPYFIYFFLGRKYNFLMSTFLLILMMLAHRFFLLPFFTTIIFACIEKKYFKRMLKIILLFLIISLPFIYLIRNLLISMVQQAFVFPTPEIILAQFTGYLYFNWAVFILLGMLPFVFNFRNDFFSYFLIMFIGLSVFSIFFGAVFGGRTDLTIEFPFVFLLGFWIENVESKSNARTISYTLIALALITVMIFGFVYLMRMGQNLSNSEMDFLDDYSANGSLLVTSRLDFYAKYSPVKNPIVAEWYDLASAVPHATSDATKLFYGLDDWRGIMGNSTIYILWNRNLDTVVNETMMNRRIDDGEIKVMINNSDFIYGELIR